MIVGQNNSMSHVIKLLHVFTCYYVVQGCKGNMLGESPTCSDSTWCPELQFWCNNVVCDLCDLSCVFAPEHAAPLTYIHDCGIFVSGFQWHTKWWLGCFRLWEKEQGDSQDPEPQHGSWLHTTCHRTPLNTRDFQRCL